MSEIVKGLVKTYKAYKTFKWVAIGGGILASGGALAIPLIASEIAEQLAEQGIAELAAGASEKLFDVTVENINGEQIFKLGEKAITEEKAVEILASEYTSEIAPTLGGVDAVALGGSIDLLVSTNQAEKEDITEQENPRLANKCLILINNFRLTEEERIKLKKHLDTVLKVSDILEQNRMLTRLLARLRKSNSQNTHGWDLFDGQTGRLNLDFA